jgi:hypothetical protein
MCPSIPGELMGPHPWPLEPVPDPKSYLGNFRREAAILLVMRLAARLKSMQVWAKSRQLEGYLQVGQASV